MGLFPVVNLLFIYTVNGKRFARLNFYGFCSFEEYHENFP